MTCYIDGHESVVAEMQKQLGIGLGETTHDSRFTLLPVCCLGNCDKAPARDDRRRYLWRLAT